MAKTRQEIAKRVIQKLGRVGRGQTVFADDLKLALDTYDLVYAALQAPELLAPWPPDDNIPDEAYLPMVALVAAELLAEFRVSDRAAAKIQFDVDDNNPMGAKSQLRANSYEGYTSENDGPVKVEYF